MAWTHLIFEAYCMYNSCKEEQCEQYTFDENDRLVSVGVKENPVHVEGERPGWCRENGELTPTPDCAYDNCPFLALTEVEPEEYDAAVYSILKIIKEEEED